MLLAMGDVYWFKPSYYSFNFDLIVHRTKLFLIKLWFDYAMPEGLYPFEWVVLHPQMLDQVLERREKWKVRIPIQA